MLPDPPEPAAGTAIAVACPACGHAFVWPPTGRCARCAVDLTSPSASEVFDLDRRWAALAAERLSRVRQLEATRPQGPPPPAPPDRGHPVPPTRAGRGSGIPALLGLAGAALLTAAAVVFTAVAWTALPAGIKAVILLGATAAAGIGALRLRDQGTMTAAAALGVLTMTLAAVDVTGAHRVGLVDLGDLAVPLGLLAAGGAGWLLARGDIEWVATLGVAAAAAGLLGCSVVLSGRFELAAPATTMLGSAGAALLGAIAPTWANRAARRLAVLLSGIGLAVAGLVSVMALGAGEAPVAASLAAIGATVAVAAAATAVDRWALAPASLLVTAAVVATGSALGAEGAALSALAAAVAAGVAWSVVLAAPAWRRPVLLGAVPVLAAALGSTLAAAGAAVERLAVVIGSGADPRPPIDTWIGGTVVFAAIAVSAWGPARHRGLPLAAGSLVLVTGALPAAAAWVVLAGAATAAVAADRFLDLDDAGLAALACALVAVGWAAPSSWSVAITAVVVVAVSAHVVWHQPGWRSMVATSSGVAGAGLAAAAASDAVGLPWSVALGGGVAALLGTVMLVQLARSRLTPPAAATALVATALVPALVDDTSEAGVLLMLAAVGWLAVAAAGDRTARWVSSVAASVGTGLLLADRGVEVVEAYTVVPGLTLGIVGVLWLRRAPAVGTLTALWPALSVALAPSLVALAADPRVLVRTLGLAVAGGVLAAVGVRLRWLAPVLAGAATATVVALTQVAVVAGAAPRWVTFAVVGGMLVWLAATYERQQSRIRAMGGRLTGFR